MKTVEKRGRTEDEAIVAALAELGVSRAEARIEVLEEARAGLFGLLGGREARVRVTVLPSREEFVEDLLRQVLVQMLGEEPVVERRPAEEYFQLVVAADERAGILIGHHGETLEALQYLLNVAAQQAERRGDIRAGGPRLLLDVAGYRERRSETIERMVKRAVAEVRRTGRPETLEPMTAHERKQVHVLLGDHPDLASRSEGEEPHRQVVISKREA